MTREEYIELADLLYPNAKDITFYFEKYPNRKVSGEVTRLGPSPTGYLHIGQLYQSLIHFLLAKHTGGIFYIRLEDTDFKREVDKAGEIAYEMLLRFGLVADEGYRGEESEIGDYGPYKQSDRIEIYHSFAHELVRRGRAFPCFCPPAKDKDEILKRRDEELEKSNDLEVKDPCRDMSLDEIKSRLKEGEQFALRLRSEGDFEKTHTFVDEIKGKKDLRENAKDDILIKSNGVPVYAFAHVVDDTLMHTTIVVRGQEWYQSLPVHLELTNALGLKPFRYAHTPNICILDESGNKRKISKRKDQFADVRFFLRKGYPTEAVLEYLLTLLSSDFEMWRKVNLDKSIFDFPFDIRKIGVTNPLFDFAKLDDISKSVISRMTADEVYNNALKWASDWDSQSEKIISKNREKLLSVLSIDRGGDRPRKDITTYSEILDLYQYVLPDFAPDFEHIEIGAIDREKLIEFLTAYTKKYALKSDNQEWFDDVKSIASDYGFVDKKTYKSNPSLYSGNIADATKFIRLAITGRTDSPELYSIMKILGADECKKRLQALINILAKKNV